MTAAPTPRLVCGYWSSSARASAAGCGLGLIVASWMLVFLRRIQVPTDPPVGLAVALDARIVAISVTVAGLSAIAFGLIPALSSLRLNVVGDLKLGPAGPPQRSRLGFRNVLVAAQVAASFHRPHHRGRGVSRLPDAIVGVTGGRTGSYWQPSIRH